MRGLRGEIEKSAEKPKVFLAFLIFVCYYK